MVTIAAMGIFLILFLNRCFGLLEDIVRMLVGGALSYIALFLSRRQRSIWRADEELNESLGKQAREATDHQKSKALYSEIETRRSENRRKTRRLERAMDQVTAARTFAVDAIHVLFIAVGVFSVFAIYGGVFDALAVRAGVETRTTDMVRMVSTGKWKDAFQKANAVLGPQWSGDSGVKGP